MRPWNPDVAPLSVTVGEELAQATKADDLFEALKADPAAFRGLFEKYVEDSSLVTALISAIAADSTVCLIDWLIENRYRYE